MGPLSPSRRGFVLAGGASRRFGADKALHPVEGLPLALRVAGALGACLPEVLLVAPDRRLEGLGLALLVEPGEGPRHPLRGVVAALERCEADGVDLAVFSPCDLPALGPAEIAALIDGPGARVAEADGRVQPLLAQLPVALLPRARAVLAEGGPARALVADARRVPLPPEALVNLNRPPRPG